VSFSVIGKRTPKRDGAEKVTGHTQFLHDVTLPRLAHGAILRTRYPHARVRRIDTSAAEALPGVLAVVTADRVEQHPFGFAKDHLALKGGAADGGKVRCIRDEIAAVAALTEEIAQEAVRLIRVDYEELPAVFDPASALRPGAPLVHEERGSNLVNLRYQFAHGDVESAFARADVVVEVEVAGGHGAADLALAQVEHVDAHRPFTACMAFTVSWSAVATSLATGASGTAEIPKAAPSHQGAFRKAPTSSAMPTATTLATSLVWVT